MTVEGPVEEEVHLRGKSEFNETRKTSVKVYL